MTTKTIVFNDNSYLSNNISQLPSHCLLNKKMVKRKHIIVFLNKVTSLTNNYIFRHIHLMS